MGREVTVPILCQGFHAGIDEIYGVLLHLGFHFIGQFKSGNGRKAQIIFNLSGQKHLAANIRGHYFHGQFFSCCIESGVQSRRTGTYNQYIYQFHKVPP